MTHRHTATSAQRRADRAATKRKQGQDAKTRDMLAEFKKLHAGARTENEKAALCDALASRVEQIERW